MGTFIEGMCGRAQYEFDQPKTIQDLWGIQLGTGAEDGGFLVVTLYVPVELRGITPLTLRTVLGTIEGAGYTDFDVAVWSFSEITETYQGIATWDDERWTWAGAGNAVEGETLLTAYKDLDISAAMTADTSHIMIALWRLEPGGGLVDDVFFMNTRTLE